MRNIRLHILRVMFSILSLWFKSVFDKSEQDPDAAPALSQSARSTSRSGQKRSPRRRLDGHDPKMHCAELEALGLAEFLETCLLPLGNVRTAAGVRGPGQPPVNPDLRAQPFAIEFDINTFRNVLCDMRNPWLLHPGPDANSFEILSAWKSYLPKQLQSELHAHLQLRSPAQISKSNNRGTVPHSSGTVDASESGLGADAAALLRFSAANPTQRNTQTSSAGPQPGNTSTRPRTSQLHAQPTSTSTESSNWQDRQLSGSVSAATSFGFNFDGTSSDPPAAEHEEVYTICACIYKCIYTYATHHLIN